MEYAAFIACVKKGKEAHQKLLCSEIDLVNKFSIRQVQTSSQYTQFATQWSAEISAGDIERRLRAVSTALEDLVVGYHRPSLLFETSPQINSGAFPHGHNIPITLASNSVITQPIDGTDEERPTKAVVKTAFNAFDGVIILFESSGPPCLMSESLDDAADLASAIGPVWSRLHSSEIRKAVDKERVKIAKASIKQTLQDGTSLRELNLADVYAWLPQMLIQHLERDHESGNIALSHINADMAPWLNYILFHIEFSNEPTAVINHCLSIYGVQDGRAHLWAGRLTLPLGHWGYYAVLGTDVGRQIVSFLARRKSATSQLGRKLLRSITIFKPDDIDNCTADELGKHQVALLFEVVDHSEALCEEARLNESLHQYREGVFPPVATVQIKGVKR